MCVCVCVCVERVGAEGAFWYAHDHSILETWIKRGRRSGVVSPPPTQMSKQNTCVHWQGGSDHSPNAFLVSVSLNVISWKRGNSLSCLATSKCLAPIILCPLMASMRSPMHTSGVRDSTLLSLILLTNAYPAPLSVTVRPRDASDFITFTSLVFPRTWANMKSSRPIWPPNSLLMSALWVLSVQKTICGKQREHMIITWHYWTRYHVSGSYFTQDKRCLNSWHSVAVQRSKEKLPTIWEGRKTHKLQHVWEYIIIIDYVHNYVLGHCLPLRLHGKCLTNWIRME